MIGSIGRGLLHPVRGLREKKRGEGESGDADVSGNAHVEFSDKRRL
jgi:hypothetical protein